MVDNGLEVQLCPSQASVQMLTMLLSIRGALFSALLVHNSCTTVKMAMDRTFAQLLLKFRTRAGLTKQELANRARIGRNSIADWEAGKRVPRSRALLQDLSEALGLSSAEEEQFFAVSRLAQQTNKESLTLENDDGSTGQILAEQKTASGARQQQGSAATIVHGSAPPLPALVIGREEDLHNLKVRLRTSVSDQLPTPASVLTAVHGWPGVGKTTLAATLAHDPDIATTFPNGVLWTSFGQQPNLLAELAAWGRALDIDDLSHGTLEEASVRLTAVLRNRRMLLIVDDVWEAEHAIPFKIGGRHCAILITTRLPKVAQALAPTPGNIYKLAVLTNDKALELLATLAPEIVTQYPQQSQELVRELEGLPLAIQVAGRLLHTEMSFGWGITSLLAELRDGVKILKAQVPTELASLMNETPPTVAALFRKSTERLDPKSRECFALLGVPVIVPKPATFDLRALQALWEMDDPRPVLRQLVGRGLLEPVGAERFQIHALLHAYARTLLTE